MRSFLRIRFIHIIWEFRAWVKCIFTLAERFLTPQQTATLLELFTFQFGQIPAGRCGAIYSSTWTSRRHSSIIVQACYLFQNCWKSTNSEKTLIELPNKAAISGKFCLKFHLIFGTRLALLSVLPQICPTLERSRSCNWTKKVTWYDR